MNGTIGAITKDQGERAIARNVPGSEKLFLCESFTCPICGGIEHGDRALNHLSLVVSVSGYHKPCPFPNCNVPKKDGWAIRHCAFCETHINYKGREHHEQHYHLGA
jgi:transcription elongation factor Elf1